MTRHERLRYEMFLRVRDFGSTHRQQFPKSSTAGKAFTTVAAAAAGLETNATAKLLAGEESRKARDAIRDAILDRLTTLARTARLAAKSTPGADRVFRLPDRRSDVALLTAARAFSTEARAAMPQFAPLGLPKTIVTELEALIDRLEQAIDGSRAVKSELAKAHAGFTAAMAKGLDAVRTLDVIVTNTLKNDPVLVTAWKRDRRLNQKGKVDRPAPPASPVPPQPVATGEA